MLKKQQLDDVERLDSGIIKKPKRYSNVILPNWRTGKQSYAYLMEDVIQYEIRVNSLG